MSGFLRRLATQAMGRARPVRSSARLPYAAAPSFVGDAEERPLVATPREPSAEAPAVTQLATIASAAPSAAGPLPSMPDEKRPARPEEAPADAAKRERMSVESPGEIAPELAVTPPQRQTPPRRTRAEPSAPHAREAAPTPLAPDAPPHAEPLLELLLPLLPRPRSAPHAVAAGPSVRAAEHDVADETTEVHVSIGRIEVTAVHEAPPPKRRAPRADKPMGLDEYLARRQGGRS